MKGRSANLGSLAPDLTQALPALNTSANLSSREGWIEQSDNRSCLESWSFITTTYISATKRKRVGVSGTFCVKTEHPVLPGYCSPAELCLL